MNSLPKTVTRQHRDCDLNPGLSVPESSMLTTPLPSHPTTLRPLNSIFSRTAWVSWYQKGKTSLDLNEARDDGVWGCTLLQTDNHINTSLNFYRLDALPDAQPTNGKMHVQHNRQPIWTSSKPVTMHRRKRPNQGPNSKELT